MSSSLLNPIIVQAEIPEGLLNRLVTPPAKKPKVPNAPKKSNEVLTRKGVLGAIGSDQSPVHSPKRKAKRSLSPAKSPAKKKKAKTQAKTKAKTQAKQELSGKAKLIAFLSNAPEKSAMSRLYHKLKSPTPSLGSHEVEILLPIARLLGINACMWAVSSRKWNKPRVSFCYDFTKYSATKEEKEYVRRALEKEYENATSVYHPVKGLVAMCNVNLDDIAIHMFDKDALVSHPDQLVEHRSEY